MYILIRCRVWFTMMKACLFMVYCAKSTENWHQFYVTIARYVRMVLHLFILICACKLHKGKENMGFDCNVWFVTWIFPAIRVSLNKSLSFSFCFHFGNLVRFIIAFHFLFHLPVSLICFLFQITRFWVQMRSK